MTITTTGAEAGRPYWLTGPCPAWCDQAHSDADPAGDRWHFAGEHTVVTLTTEDAEVEAIAGGQPEASAADLAAYLRQDYRESEPRILLLHNDRDSAYLTLSEAEDLALGVLRLVQLARSAVEKGT